MMVTLFENTNVNARGNKKFTLVVNEVEGVGYEVIQRLYKVYGPHDEKLVSEKTDKYSSLQDLMKGEFTRRRQGTLFLMALSDPAQSKI